VRIHSRREARQVEAFRLSLVIKLHRALLPAQAVLVNDL
jgi:hypothetical protein